MERDLLWFGYFCAAAGVVVGVFIGWLGWGLP